MGRPVKRQETFAMELPSVLDNSCDVSRTSATTNQNTSPPAQIFTSPRLVSSPSRRRLASITPLPARMTPSAARTALKALPPVTAPTMAPQDSAFVTLRPSRSPANSSDPPTELDRLQQQVATLQARLLTLEAQDNARRTRSRGSDSGSIARLRWPVGVALPCALQPGPSGALARRPSWVAFGPDPDGTGRPVKRQETFAMELPSVLDNSCDVSRTSATTNQNTSPPAQIFTSPRLVSSPSRRRLASITPLPARMTPSAARTALKALPPVTAPTMAPQDSAFVTLRPSRSPANSSDPPTELDRLQQQVATLQARLLTLEAQAFGSAEARAASTGVSNNGERAPPGGSAEAREAATEGRDDGERAPPVGSAEARAAATVGCDDGERARPGGSARAGPAATNGRDDGER